MFAGLMWLRGLAWMLSVQWRVASLLLLTRLVPSTAQYWSYSGQLGPSHWADVSSSCSGQHQSPVAIHSGSTEYLSSLTAFDLGTYNDIPPHSHWEMVNTGLMLKVDITGGLYLIRDGGLDGDYRAFEFHWHWGANDSWGAEHAVDGLRAPMEMHISHYDVKYGSRAEAAKHPHGLATLAFTYSLGKLDHPGYSQIVKLLENVTYPGDHIAVRPVNIMSLLPSNLNHYFRYEGSMTTPPCTESVIWTIFKESILISNRQMRAIRTSLMKTSHSVAQRQVLVDNFRELQLLNDRVVYSSDPSHQRFSFTSPISITIAVMMGIIILLLFLRH